MINQLRGALNSFFENRLCRKPIVTDPTEEVLKVIMPIIEPGVVEERDNPFTPEISDAVDRKED